MGLKDTTQIAHDFLSKLCLLGTLQDQEYVIQMSHVIDHELGVVELVKLAFDHRDEAFLLFLLSVGLLLLFLSLDCCDLCTEEVVDDDRVLEYLKGILILHDHFGKLSLVLLTKLEILFLLCGGLAFGTRRVN